MSPPIPRPRPLVPGMKAAVDQFAAVLRSTQTLPHDALVAYQRGLLEQLVRHARAHVPFYRDSGRLDPLFRADGGIDWDRWREVPLLTRREVQQAGTALHSEQLNPAHGHTWVLTTSGSTGEPVSILHSALSGQIAWTAILLRDLERHRLDTALALARVRSFLRDERLVGGKRYAPAWFAELGAIGRNGPCLEVAEFLPRPQIIDEFVEFAPKYLAGTPLQLELTCAWDHDRRLSELGLLSVTTDADRMSDDAKVAISEHFGCPIMDRYSSNECGIMATSCPECGRLHVHAETIHVEVLDDDGTPTAPGGTGWLAATPLYNYAMPLIRYDHADRAKVGAPGACRITLPAFETIGKVPTLFVFAGGHIVRPRIPPATIIRCLGAQSFQVAQVAPDRCEFRLVPGPIAPEDMQFDEVTALLRRRWWPDLQIDYRILDEMPGTGSRRKQQTFVREIDPPAVDPTLRPLLDRHRNRADV